MRLKLINFKSKIKKYIPIYFLELRKKYWADGSINKFSFDKELNVKDDIKNKYNYNGDLLRLFGTNKKFVVHKWHHYIPIYDKYFHIFRNTNVRILEIGVSKGGSLMLWRNYFGKKATIFGIDIDPKCAKYNNISGQVRIGSQLDNTFLVSVIKEMGGVDIIIDDGSHKMKDITYTLKCLYPLLNFGGIYLIEDLHTSYWRSYQGGYYSRKNFFNLIRNLIDDMHHWYHQKKINYPHMKDSCSSIHIYDSMVILEKNKNYYPVHSIIF